MFKTEASRPPPRSEKSELGGLRAVTLRLFGSDMPGMRLGGIDPSVLRELSGVYTPFVKAFKELISNSFDADATSVLVQFTDDFFSVTVTDDGHGMSPFEFRNDFTRIGGGSRRWVGERTRRGAIANWKQGDRLPRDGPIL